MRRARANDCLFLRKVAVSYELQNVYAGQLSFKALPMPTLEDGLGEKRNDFLKPKDGLDAAAQGKRTHGGVRGASMGSSSPGTGVEAGKEATGKAETGPGATVAEAEGKATEDAGEAAASSSGAEKKNKSAKRESGTSADAKTRKRIRPALHEFKGKEASF